MKKTTSLFKLCAFLIAFVALGNTRVWAWEKTSTVKAIAGEGGTVCVNNSNTDSGRAYSSEDEISTKISGTTFIVDIEGSVNQYFFAKPNDGYVFVGWSETENSTSYVSTSAQYTNTNKSRNQNVSKTLYANFVSLEGKFTNPILQQDAADPSVILAEDGYWYMYCSEASSGQGIPVWRSADMINWTQITTIFATRPTNVRYTYLWAPEIAYVNGKYVLYYANADYGTQANTQICVATSDNPYGPFENNKILIHANSSDNGALNAGVNNVIDPSLFRDDDGKNYLIWGSFNGVYYVELDANCTSLAADAAKKSLVKGTSGDWTAIEAPMVVKRDGYYYLIASKGTTVNASNASGINYQLLMARSTSLGDTFYNTDNQDAFSNRRTMSNLLQGGGNTDYVLGPGHSSQIITDKNGTEYIFYHGYSKTNGSWDYPGPRKLFASKVLWGNWTAGWPGIMPPSANEVIEMPAVDGPTPEQIAEATTTDYEISNADQLIAFAAKARNGKPWLNAKLMNDIDMNGKSWTPIGKQSSPFRGTIDGQGHRIKNLNFDNSGVATDASLITDDEGAGNRQGLIGTATGGATIKDLIIDASCSIKGGKYTGAFIGRADGSGQIHFERCGNEATVTGGQNTAGFIGCSSGVSIYWDDCYNTGNINGDNESAAFSGWGADKLTNCWNTGRTMGCAGAGDGKWLSLTRGMGDEGYVNTYDLNSENAPIDVNRLADYDASWLTNGKISSIMNNERTSEDFVWCQKLGTDAYPRPLKTNSTYERALTSSNYFTLCLPFNAESFDGAKIYSIAGKKVNSEGVATSIMVTDVEAIEAGVPYICKPTSDKFSVTFTKSAFVEEGSSNGFYGKYSLFYFKNWDGYVTNDIYVLTNNEFKKGSKEKSGVKAYGAFVKMSEVSIYDPSAGVKAFRLGLEGMEDDEETTAIESINTEKGELIIYNMQGQRVYNPSRGIFIVNGKKVMLK